MALPFAGALGGVLITITGSIVGRVLASLGLSLITYVGINQSMDWLRDRIIVALAGLPPDVVQILGLLKVGTCLTILFSCMFASMLLTGMSSDTFKKWIIQ